MKDELDYLVTPLVFDLELSLDPASMAGGNGNGSAEGWRILQVGQQAAGVACTTCDTPGFKYKCLWPRLDSC